MVAKKNILTSTPKQAAEDYIYIYIYIYILPCYGKTP